jgi:hypothetical protein
LLDSDEIEMIPKSKPLNDSVFSTLIQSSKLAEKKDGKGVPGFFSSPNKDSVKIDGGLGSVNLANKPHAGAPPLNAPITNSLFAPKQSGLFDKKDEDVVVIANKIDVSTINFDIPDEKKEAPKVIQPKQESSPLLVKPEEKRFEIKGNVN